MVPQERAAPLTLVPVVQIMAITIFGINDELLDDYECPSRRALNGFIPAIRRISRKVKGKKVHSEGAYASLWDTCLSNIDIAVRDLYMVGYDFMLFGSRLANMEKLKHGENLTAMLVVLRNGSPINPLYDYGAMSVLRSIESFRSTSEAVSVRHATWRTSGSDGFLTLHMYTPRYASKDIELAEDDPWVSLVPGIFSVTAPVLELNAHFPQLTSVGSVQQSISSMSGRLGLCIDYTHTYVVR